MIIKSGQILKSGYVPTNEIVFQNDVPMAVASVKEKIDQFTSIGDNQAYPLPLGKWIDDKFHLWDGRHRYIASLMLGRKTMLVAWVEEA